MRHHLVDHRYCPEVIINGGWEKICWKRWKSDLVTHVPWDIRRIDTSHLTPVEFAEPRRLMDQVPPGKLVAKVVATINLAGKVGPGLHFHVLRNGSWLGRCHPILREAFKMKLDRFANQFGGLPEGFANCHAPGQIRDISAVTVLAFLNDNCVTHKLTSSPESPDGRIGDDSRAGEPMSSPRGAIAQAPHEPSFLGAGLQTDMSRSKLAVSLPGKRR